MRRKVSIRRLFEVIAAAVVLSLSASLSHAEQGKRTLRIMTRNMDSGTDLTLMFAPNLTLPERVSATLAQAVSTDIPGRARRLAEEIRASEPDVIALQEATLWQAGACTAGPMPVLYDQLKLLEDALAARNMHYTEAAVNILTSIKAPALSGCVAYTDRDALLVRTDLRPHDLEVVNATTAIYNHKLDLSGFGFPPLLRGYISADITTRGETVRLFATHLESTYPFEPGLTQEAQTAELLAAAGSTGPVLLCGDFNSNAEPGPEHTGTVALILAAGFTDVWTLFNPPATGFTWPLYFEDTASGPATPNERIDLIFSRGVRALKVEETGLRVPWASDHAGVAAMFQIGK